ncbi:MAG: biopolymer transporter ExbD [Porphyrobacter sp.]|nr:biopolymer transporter ExbD [Porphyrobacter sp.]
MNVTPFIDVLLVLLIMLILAIPMPVNVTPVDLPSGDPPLLPIREKNTIAIGADDNLSWNGNTVTTAGLRAQVAAASAMDVPASLLFAPDALASYDKAARTIALMREEGADGFAFVGNEQHRNF